MFCLSMLRADYNEDESGDLLFRVMLQGMPDVQT